MLTGILVPTVGPAAGRRARPEPAAHRAGPPDRRGLRPAHDAVVGPAAARLLRRCCRRSTGSDPTRHRAQPRRVRRAARPRRAARHPGAAAQPGPADARRHRGRAAARPRDPLPRRAHHRPRRGEQGPAARVPAHPQRRARHHAAADHPRPPGHRGAVRPGDRDRPRHRRLRRRRSPTCTARAARRRTLVVDLVDEAPPIEVPGARHAPRRGPAAVAQLPGRRQRRARSSRPSPRRTTSPTCRSRSPTSRTSSATSTPVA